MPDGASPTLSHARRRRVGMSGLMADRIALTCPPTAGGANELLWSISQFQRLPDPRGGHGQLETPQV